MYQKIMSVISVLYSGGLDSTLTAAILARKGYNLHLITCDNGVSYGIDASRVHVRELEGLFPQKILTHEIIRVGGLFKTLSLIPIEEDFKKYGNTNLVCLGCKLSMFTHAMIYSIENGIDTIVDGFNKRQDGFPEQKLIVKNELKKWMKRYNIEYVNPIYSDYSSKDEVKAKLFDMGLLPKSIEATCMFGDTFSPTTDEHALAYIIEKISISDDYIKMYFKERRSDIS
jgi:predicted subunit of tRNA(5-methylaminomethyl-2-thiouridylate) methyltransferase